MGAGAIGSVVGGLLKKSGQDVTLLGRPAHIEAIRRDGLRISGIWGEHCIRNIPVACQTEELNAPFEIVLLTVKAYDTESAALQAAPLMAPDSLMVSFQNGLGNMESIAEVVGAKRTGGARVIFGAELEDKGAVRVTVYAEPVMIAPFGRPPQPSVKEKIEWLAQALNGAGVPSAYTDDVTPFLWAKVFYNAPLNPLSALLRSSYGELADNPFTKPLMDQIICEAFQVAQKKGVALPWKSCEEFLDVFYHKLIPPTSAHYASMLRDIERGKKTEIDAINGMVCRYAEELGMTTPINESMVQLIKFLEFRTKPLR